MSADDDPTLAESIRDEIERRSDWAEENAGPRCTVEEPNCLCCQVWMNHDEFVRLTGLIDADK